ncbi:hypothetical protein [Methylomicrobium lacus]|uniref:hypothetical protein n=1 Tax=Methylomicrobium lacus TaxID=136992 RepID=UPI0035A9A254
MTQSLSLPVLLLAGCSTLPMGPSVLVLPGSDKSFEQFRADDTRCRQYAFAQTGGVTPSQVATESGVGKAGAGTISGSETARATGYEAQQRYDMGYIQCMYAYGNQVPVSGAFADETPDAGQYPEASYPLPGMQAPALPPDEARSRNP